VDKRGRGGEKYCPYGSGTNLKSLQINPFFHIRYDNIGCLPFEVFKYMIHFSIDEPNKTVIVLAVISTYQDPKQNWLYSI
jgi:hypothetical protein